MEWKWVLHSRQERDFQSFEMRLSVMNSIEMEEGKKALRYFWNHLNDLRKGFRSKTFFGSRAWRDVQG